MSYLRRAAGLAMVGRGRVEPNPMVGCVLVRDSRIIGQGIHQEYGHPHAEPNALAACTQSPTGATAFVTLEPCCHTNKQTPPCVPRLIDARLARVVIGCLDPNPAVNGKGAGLLRSAGMVVDIAENDGEFRQLIAPVIARTSLHRPYVTMKWAESADGKIAGPGGKRAQISNAASSRQVQLLRSRCDAILVGINTVLNDDPVLLPRDVPMLRPLRRMVLDRRLRFPLDSKLIKTLAAGPVQVYTDQPLTGDRAKRLIDAGLQIFSAADWLCDPAVTNLMIEPGPTLADNLLNADRTRSAENPAIGSSKTEKAPVVNEGSVDRLWVIRSPKLIGDADGTNAPPSAARIPGHFIQTGEIDLQGDRLCEYVNSESPVFFGLYPSADFELCRRELGH